MLSEDACAARVHNRSVVSRHRWGAALDARVGVQSAHFVRGLVFVGSVSCAGCDGGCVYCPGDDIVVTRAVTDELRSALGGIPPDATACQRICNTGNSSGRIDDAGGEDAGPDFASWGVRWRCTVEEPVVRCVGSTSCGE